MTVDIAAVEPPKRRPAPGVCQSIHPGMIFLAAVVMAPTAEELFFRGIILRGYRVRYGLPAAVIVSALVFAIFHLNPWQAVVAFPLGLGFAWLVVRTGSLAPAVIGHAAANFSANFLLQPLARALGPPAAEFEASDHFPASMLVVAAILSATGVALLAWQLRKSPPVPGPSSIEPAAPDVPATPSDDGTRS